MSRHVANACAPRRYGNLRRLWLRWGSITTPVLRVLAQAPWWQNLEELALNFNQLGDEGAAFLVKVLPSEGLKVLSLGQCGIGPDGTMVLTQSPHSLD